MKILVIGPSWVGDMVMAQSSFKALHQCHEELILDVLAPAWSEPLLARMPEVNDSINMPIGHGKLDISARRKLAAQLRHGQYDQAIVLPNSLKSALIPAFARIPKRTGWRGEMRYGLLNDLRILNKSQYPLMIQRFAALAFDKDAEVPQKNDIPQPLLKVNQKNIDAKMTELGLDLSKPILALCPGAEFGAAKRWPEASYSEIARLRIHEGWQVWLFGSDKDRGVAEVIKQGLIQEDQTLCVNLTGKTALADAIDLLSLATTVISNDSGLMHIAAALQRPMVVVYGSTSAAFTPPLYENVQTVSSQLPCSPCFKRECPYGHYRCLKELGPEQVELAFHKLSLVRSKT